MEDCDPRESIRATLARYEMAAPGDRIGVAVSGGSDSVALLLLLHDLAPALGLQLAVLHLDHALRPESAADAEFVRQLAERLGLPLLLRVANLARPGENLEQAARRVRYGFFEAAVDGGEVDCVATAHTADDQAETVLLRLLRGAGTRGLAGIWPVMRTADHQGSRVRPRMIRPALHCRRDDLRAWLRARGQTWREDTTNLDLSRRRNRIRHELLPQLIRAYNPRAVQNLSDLAEIARAEEEYWRGEVGRLMPELWRPVEGGLEAATAALAGAPLALARRLLRTAIAAVQGDLRRVDFRHVDAALRLIQSAGQAGAKRLVFGGVELQVTRRTASLRGRRRRPGPPLGS